MVFVNDIDIVVALGGGAISLGAVSCVVTFLSTLEAALRVLLPRGPVLELGSLSGERFAISSRWFIALLLVSLLGWYW